MSRLASLFVFLVCFGVSTAAATPPPLRFSADFPLSPAMEERVRFWIRVFTEWPQNVAVLHDRDDVRVVYDVIPYRGSDRAIEPVRASYARLLGSMAIGEIFPAALRRPVDAAFVPASPERLRVGALFASQTARSSAFTRASENIRIQRGQREIFADSLVRAELYLPAIRRIFAAAHLPAELVYLPHVESSFNPNATSRA
jgi:membrane-bound lytic murein transglycosylase D